MTVKIPTQLRAATNGVGEVCVAGDTVGDVVAAVGKAFPELIERIAQTDDSKYGFTPRRFLNIYVGGEDIDYQQGLETPLTEETEVTLLPASAGG